MDLTGRAPGYRGAAIRCPGCAEAMTQHALEECEVDVCTACGGIWVDWFDGEIRKVTTDALRSAPSRPPPERPARNEALASGACPRCTRQLAPDRYLLDGRLTSVELLRCSDCLGVFVSKPSSELLASLDPDAAPPPPPGTDAGAWQRLIEVVKQLLGLSPAS